MAKPSNSLGGMTNLENQWPAPGASSRRNVQTRLIGLAVATVVATVGRLDAFLTEKQGLSKKPAFIGTSRGGQYAYTRATAKCPKYSTPNLDSTTGASKEPRSEDRGSRLLK